MSQCAFFGGGGGGGVEAMVGTVWWKYGKWARVRQSWLIMSSSRMLCNRSQHPPTQRAAPPPAVHRAASAGYDQYTLVYSACNLHPLTNRSMLDVYRDLIASTSREHAPCTLTSPALPRQSSRARPRAARHCTPPTARLCVLNARMRACMRAHAVGL